MDLTEFQITDVQRLNLAPGEVLVVSVDSHISMETARRIRDHVESLLPGNKCLVMEDGMSLSVIKPEAETCAA